MGVSSIRVLLVALALSFSNTAHAEHPCGYPLDDGKVIRMDGSVPLAVQSAGSVERVSRFQKERRAHFERKHALSETCPQAERYLNQVLQRLIEGSQLQSLTSALPHLRLQVNCSQKKGLPVARAFAGRVIVVPLSLALNTRSEDAIAAVLAHELAHITLSHSERLFTSFQLKTLSQSGQRIRERHEIEADATGLRILVNSGYDPLAAVDHLEQVSSQRFLHKELHIERRRANLLSQIKNCGYRSAKHHSLGAF